MGLGVGIMKVYEPHGTVLHTSGKQPDIGHVGGLHNIDMGAKDNLKMASVPRVWGKPM